MSQKESPFASYDQGPAMAVGGHEATLTDIDVIEISPPDKEPYKMLKYVFTNADDEEAYKWAGATWGAKSKVNRPFVAMLSGSGIPAEALANGKTFWEYTQTLIGNRYNISVALDDKMNPSVVAAMPIKGATKAAPKAKAKSSIDEDDIAF